MIVLTINCILPNDTLSTAFQTINKAITGVVRSLAQLVHSTNNGNISFGDIEEVMRGAGIIRAGAGVAPSADMAARGCPVESYARKAD